MEESKIFDMSTDNKKIKDHDRDLETSCERRNSGKRDIFEKEKFDVSSKNLKIWKFQNFL